jgi:hypothetical protein
MITAVKEVLQPVVDFLNDESQLERVRAELWDILSALRGPDSGNVQLKEQTTERIRYAIGLKGPEKFGNSEQIGVAGKILISTNPLPEQEKAFFVAKAESEHFAHHVAEAIKAITRIEETK